MDSLYVTGLTGLGGRTKGVTADGRANKAIVTDIHIDRQTSAARHRKKMVRAKRTSARRAKGTTEQKGKDVDRDRLIHFTRY